MTNASASGSGSREEGRLARLNRVMAGYVERGEVPGIVTAVARHGEVARSTLGESHPQARPRPRRAGVA